MYPLNNEQIKKRQKVLLTGLLLSIWAPFVTIIAFLKGPSYTQLADILRRTVELIALFVSWLVFKILSDSQKSHSQKIKLAKYSKFCVTAALGFSGILMLVLVIDNIASQFKPSTSVYGLIVPTLGIITNGYFWRRYHLFYAEKKDTVMNSQKKLYRAKTFVDLCVFSSLLAISLLPTSISRYTDIIASLAVAFYLIYSSYNTARSPLESEGARDKI